MSGAGDSRVSALRATLSVQRAPAEGDEGLVRLSWPGVGLWAGAPRPGELLGPGAAVGELWVLGRRTALALPHGVHGRVVEVAGQVEGRARRPVDAGTTLLVLDPRVGQAEDSSGAAGPGAAAGLAAGALVVRSPTSGRFYSRPSPDQPPFVAVGDAVGPGATLALLEVMKTFHRVHYPDQLPPRATIAAVLVADGDDVDDGAPLFALRVD